MFLAVLSFLLGLLSCFACVFGVYFGAPAIVLGIIAGIRLTPVSVVSPSARWARRGIVLGSIGVAVALIWLAAHLYTSRARSGYHSTCQNNLKQIGVIMKMYAGENQGALPDTLSRTYPEYASDLTVFVCPQSGHKPGDPARIDKWSDYTYVPGLRMTQPIANSRARSCYHYEQDAELPGWNELYLDGHVEYRVDWDSPRAKQQREY